MKKTKKIEEKQGEARVSKQRKVGREEGKTEETTEKVGEPRMFEDPPCNVGVNMATTVNLGNYESVKLGVSLHVPCKHEEINDTFDFARGWVEEKMTELVESVQTEE